MRLEIVPLPNAANSAFADSLSLAGARVLQGVAFGGFLCSVAPTMAATWELVIRGIRPGRGASFSTPAARNARNRCLHSCTVGREMRNRAAISWLSVPSAASRTTRARCAKRCGWLLAFAQDCRVARSWRDKTTKGARLLMGKSVWKEGLYVAIYMTHYTRKPAAAPVSRNR